MEIKVGALTAAALGSLVGLTITRPSSYTETAVALFTGGVSATYLGGDLSHVLHFSDRTTIFLVGVFGFAAAKLINSIFIKIHSDPLAAFDKIVSGLASRFIPKEAS